MGTVRDALLPVVDRIQGVITTLGFRQTQVLLRTRTWSSGITGQGTKTDVDVDFGVGPYNARPKVFELGDGHFRISKITPAYTGGGFSATSLTPNQPPGTEIYIVLNGPDGFVRECRIIETHLRRPLVYDIIVKDRR